MATGQGSSFFDFSATSEADYRQSSATSVAFEGGTFAVRVQDGEILYQPGCIDIAPFPPSIACPLGSTGVGTQGDIDGDGVVDAGAYVSVSAIQNAVLLKSFEPSRARLIAAPPSQLPRPLAGFTDRSASFYYDLRTSSYQQYDVALYTFERLYTAGERNRFDGELVPGTYVYSFAGRSSPTANVPISINLVKTLDGYRTGSGAPRGVRFTGLQYRNGFALLDPNFINTITWEGNDATILVPTVDRQSFSIRQLVDPTNPLSAVSTTLPPLFPSFTASTTASVTLPNALVKTYTIPPNFLFSGNTGVMELEYQMNRATTTTVVDRTIRRFRVPVKVTTPFVIPAPGNATSGVFNSPTGDFDGDGVNNFDEWVFGTNRNSASSVPTMPALVFNPLGGAAGGGGYDFGMTKKVYSVPELVYEIEKSTDLINWTTIGLNDPNWQLTDTPTSIKITSIGSVLVGNEFVRMKVTPL